MSFVAQANATAGAAVNLIRGLQTMPEGVSLVEALIGLALMTGGGALIGAIAGTVLEKIFNFLFR